MPRYYFDIHDGEDFVPADEGQWFPDVEAAKIEAKAVLAELICGGRSEKLVLTIRDANGNTLAEAEGAIRVAMQKRDHHK
jgi:hypothetical protein